MLVLDEEAPLRARYWQVKAGDTAIDVGSFEGSYSLPALDAGADVYAVDARAHTLVALRARAASLGLDGRLTTVHLALSDGEPYPEGLVEAIETGPAPSRGMAPAAKWSTLDKFVEGYGIRRVDWLKVDVEGGEASVLEGAAETLRAHHPRLLVEDHSRVYPWVGERGNTARLLALLGEYGYGTTEFVGDTYPDYVAAWEAE